MAKRLFLKLIALFISVSICASIPQIAAASSSEYRVSTLAPKNNIDDFNLELVLQSKRGLVVCDNPDVVDQELMKMAKARGVKYLRLTLNDQKELDRLMTRVHVHDGKLDVSKGDIPEIIEEGGILLIDYTGSCPQFIEEFNSLFDKEPFFEKCKNVSKKLIVVGVIGDDRYLESDSTFRSRFTYETLMGKTYKDPLEDIGLPPKNANPITVQLYGTPQFREELIGRPNIDSEGVIYFSKGPLVEAVLKNRPIVIKGDNWNNPDFLHFIRQILMRNKIEFNGRTRPLPKNFKIYKGESDYGKGIKDKKIITSNESKLTGEKLWIINEQNQDILFSRTHIKAGKLTQLPGLLSEKKLRVRLTGPVSDWVWHMIMHASGKIEVEITSDCPVPPLYLSYRSEKAKGMISEEKLKTWDETMEIPSSHLVGVIKSITPTRNEDGDRGFTNDKVIFVEGTDMGFIKAKIEEDIGEIITYPVTPGTAYSQLTSSVEIEPGRGKLPIFKSQIKDILKLLREGKTILLEGIETNPSILAYFSTALCETPYIIENGQRVDLTKFKGRLIIASRPQTVFPVRAVNHVRLDPDDKTAAGLLKKRFPKYFNQENFAKLQRLKKIFETIPAPSIGGLYPIEPNFSFNRLCMLYEYEGDWLKAFEDVIISRYNGDPETASFIRVMARLVFDIDEVTGNPNTIYGRKLQKILNKTVPPEKWDKNFWQFADTLSLDLLQKAGVGEDMLRPDKTAVFKIIQEALIKHHKWTWKDFYRHKFNIRGDVKDAAKIDYDLRVGEENWRQREERIIRLLDKFNAVFLRGPPGTGKSYITKEIAETMGYSMDKGEVIGPVTTGVDLSESDIISRQEIKDGKTVAKDEAVGTWIPPCPAGSECPPKRHGRLFIVDEANLTVPQFWNFLRAFFEKDPTKRYLWVNGKRRWFVKDDRMIFTGNQETVEGRKFQELFDEYIATVNFTPFDKNFLRDRLKEYLNENIHKKDQLIDLMGDLHSTFEEINPDISFSLRDIQMFAAQANLFLTHVWLPEDVIYQAWKLYRGLFSPNEAAAAEHIICNRFGVIVSKFEDRDIWNYMQVERGKYLKSGITLVQSTAKMALSIKDFLKVREKRVENKSLIEGKGGMIFEGPSGRGKDITLLHVLNERGYRDAKSASINFPADKIYYHINASLRPEEMLATIRKAQKDGSIVIISEMNRLPSAFLEGKLNDVLTGNAHEGFALFATVNSLDFGARERLSTALQNRTIYQRVMEYTQDELKEIAMGNRGRVSEKDVKMIVNTHTWIRENSGRPNRQPTTREIIKTLKLMNEKDIGWRDAVEAVYGPFYLRKALKGKNIPKDAALLKFQEKGAVDNIEVMRIATSMVTKKGLPDIKIDAVTEQGGGYDDTDHSVIISSKSTTDVTLRYLVETVEHEAGHGKFTRNFDGLTPSRIDPFHWLYMWLEDCRMEHAVKTNYPWTGLSAIGAQEIGFSVAVNMLDVDYIFEMTPQDLFKYLLSTYSRGLITKAEIKNLTEVMEGIYPVNIPALALRHLDTAKAVYECIPRSLDEEEIQYQQYCALLLMQKMRDDYFLVWNCGTEKGEEEETLTEEEQKAEVEKALDTIKGADLRPQERDERQNKLPAKVKIARERIEQIKKSLMERKKISQAKTKEDILKELDLMKSDLGSPYGVTNDRIEEITAQLENRYHPASLTLRIEQLNDPDINRGVKAIKTLVKKAKEINKNIRDLSKDPLFRGSLDIMRGLGVDFGLEPGLGGLGRFGEFGGVGAPIVARYPIARAHAEDIKENPISVTVHKPKPEKRNLAVRDTFKRNPAVEYISKQQKTMLDDAIRDFFRDKMEIKSRVYGLEGTFDVNRFAAGNYTTSFYSTGGIREKTQKEIVLSGRMGADGWNIITEEFFAFLIQENFHITVYTSENSYVENIRTLSDLKKILEESEDVPEDKVKSDLSSRKRKENYEYVKITEVQKRVEAVYLYGAVKAAERGELPKAELEKPVGLSFDEQVEFAKAFLKRKGISMIFHVMGSESERVIFDKTNQTLYLNLVWQDIDDSDLKDISKLTNLWSLTLNRTQITDIRPLSGITNLVWLYLNNTRITDDQIYEFIRDHPNRDNLRVYNRADKEIRYDNPDFPAKYKTPAVEKEMSFDEQVEFAKKFLRDRGFSSRFLTYNNIEQTLNLNLVELDIDDSALEDISKLTNLRHLDLGRNKITDISPLSGLTNLVILSLHNNPVTDIRPLSVLTNLVILSLGSNPVTDISPLSGLTNLHRLYLMKTPVTDDQIYKFICDHPKRDNLMVVNSANKGIRYTDPDFPAQYKTPAVQKELSFDEQVKFAKTFLKRKKLDPICLEIDKVGQTLSLYLGSCLNIDNSDLKDISRLTKLVDLGLGDSLVTDLSSLSGLANLERLSLINTQVSDDKICEFIRDHPKRDNLVVRNYAGEEIKYNDPNFPAEYKIPPVTKPADPLVIQIVNALADPQAAFEKAAQLFQREGDPEEFYKVLTSLKSDARLPEEKRRFIEAQYQRRYGPKVPSHRAAEKRDTDSRDKEDGLVNNSM